MFTQSQDWRGMHYPSRYAVHITLPFNKPKKPDNEMRRIFSRCIASAQSNVDDVHVASEDEENFSLVLDADGNDVIPFINHLCHCFTFAENARRKNDYIVPLVSLSRVPGGGDFRATPPAEPDANFMLVC